MSEHASALIVGGGIIGSSIAWALAERGTNDITVVDLDLAGVYGSSELNAGGARATWWQPVNIESCLHSLDFFREHAALFGWRPTGHLWLYTDEDLYERALSKVGLQNGYGLEVETLDPAELTRCFPIMDRHVEEIAGASFSPHDGPLNPNAVRAFYRRSAEALGVRFRNRDYVTGVETRRSIGPGGRLRHVSAKIGVRDVTEPVRRQITLLDVHAEDVRPDVDLHELGMLVDGSGLYLHSEGGHVLAGYSTPDEPLRASISNTRARDSSSLRSGPGSHTARAASRGAVTCVAGLASTP